MISTIKVAKLSAGTVYKLVLVGLLAGFFPLFVLFGILGSMDLLTMTWNEQPVTGLKALVVGPLMGVFFALVFTALVGSVIALGLWLFGKFRPLTLEYVPIEATESGQ